MKALVLASKQMLTGTETTKPTPGKGEVLIKIWYAALNHLDLWIWKEKVQN